ncbi:hypothetical protein ABIE78_005463 [Sinorhizobium fredii]
MTKMPAIRPLISTVAKPRVPRKLVQEIGAGIIEKQDEDELGYRPDDGRIAFQQVAQHRSAIELAEGAADAERQPECIAANGDFNRMQETLQQNAAPAGRREREQAPVDEGIRSHGNLVLQSGMRKSVRGFAPASAPA